MLRVVHKPYSVLKSIPIKLNLEEFWKQCHVIVNLQIFYKYLLSINIYQGINFEILLNEGIYIFEMFLLVRNIANCFICLSMSGKESGLYIHVLV